MQKASFFEAQALPLTRCCSNVALAFCSCTSCALQNGHQSAERKKSMTVPLEPFKDSFDCLWPN